MTRIFAVADSAEAVDPQYQDGLRAAVSAAVEYGLAAVDGDESPPPVPAAVLTQARLAARNNVSLDTVLRRYFAGYSLFGDFLVDEAEDGRLEGPALRRLLRTQATLFDRLIVAVTEEYTRESESWQPSSSEQRRVERVERLLAGERLDTTALQYDFNARHIGIIAVGQGAEQAIRSRAKQLDCRLLLVNRDEEVVWAWLASRHWIDPAWVDRLLSAQWPAEMTLAIGELGHELEGWHRTHQQARAAMRVALRSDKPVTRYADVALVASLIQDDVVVASLRNLYLAPLAEERDGGAVLRETLRAYLAAERNASSAAAALGVSRQTVTRHLQTIEQRLGRTLGTCAVEVELALRLEELGDARVVGEHLA